MNGHARRLGALVKLFGVMVAISLVAPGQELSGQSIRGRVVDAESGFGIPTAEVRFREVTETEVRQVLTDLSGNFWIDTERPGSFVLSARSLGYVGTDSTLVQVEIAREEVEVLIRLSTRAIEIEGISVIARGLDLRHQQSLEGFYKRRETARDIGNSRLLTREDAAMANASKLRDIFQWFPSPLPCMEIFLDGRSLRGFQELGGATLEGYEAVEFYRFQTEAPLPLRVGKNCPTASQWSVVALWSGRARPENRTPDAGEIVVLVMDSESGQPIESSVFMVRPDFSIYQTVDAEDGRAIVPAPEPSDGWMLMAGAEGYLSSAPQLIEEFADTRAIYFWLTRPVDGR